MVRVVVVDDHAILRQALATLLNARPNVSVVGEGSDGREAVVLAGTLRPDVVLMDVVMSRLGGFEATRTIRARFPAVRVLMLSAYGDAMTVGRAMGAGASGFIIKKSDIDELVLALELVVTGNVYFSRELAERLDVAEIAFNSRTQTPSNSGLTDREREVLQLIAEGHTMKSIAELLVISAKTVHGHNSRILAKTGARNRADLVRYAIGAGLVQFDSNPDTKI